MGYDLRPRNKAAGDFSIEESWLRWMLEHGVGLPLGCGPGFSKGYFICRTRPDGKCIGCDDGARVTAAEAKDMARAALWLADYQDALYAQWMKASEQSRQRMQDDITRIYTLPVRRDIVEKMRAFADWAKRSGGFRVC